MKFVHYSQVKIIATGEIGIYIGVATIPCRTWENITDQYPNTFNTYPHMVEVNNEMKFIYDEGLEKV